MLEALSIACLVVVSRSGPIVPSLLPLVDFSAAKVSQVLPIPLDDFFSHWFNNKMLRLNRTESGLDVRKHLWDQQRDLPQIAAAMDRDRKLFGAMKVYGDGGSKDAQRAAWLKANGLSDADLRDDASGNLASRLLREGLLAKGRSFMLQFENVSPQHRPYKWLSDGLFNLTGIPASIHLYCSAKGATVLRPHTDPYDVLVWQLEGVKQWRACVPRAEIGASLEARGVELSDAQRCELQELSKENIAGCTTYSVDDTHSLECTDFRMAPGDVLYMPKGVVHYALTEDGAEAYHLTVGLHRDNMQWRDVFYGLLATDASGTPLDRDADAGADDGGDAARLEAMRTPIEMLQVYSETAEGLHLFEFVPGWLLLCRRAWNRGRAVALDAELAAVGEHSCAARDGEMRRLYGLHLERFGTWMHRRARQGGTKEGLALAEREKRPGEPLHVEGVAHLIWWDGDLSFFHTLRPSEETFGRVLDWLATVDDYAQSQKPRWRRRRVGGRARATDLRSLGQSPAHGERTLCDEMDGWTSECPQSDRHHCEVRVGDAANKSWAAAAGAAAAAQKRAPPGDESGRDGGGGAAFTCEAFCEAQGGWCEAAWNDGRGICTHDRRRSSLSSCSAERTQQVCRCRRACVDEGPWSCEEEGCESRLVHCARLAQVACRYRFSHIWRKPPLGYADMTVQQACPLSCGACACPRAEYNWSLVRFDPRPPFITAKNATGILDEVETQARGGGGGGGGGGGARPSRT